MRGRALVPVVGALLVVLTSLGVPGSASAGPGRTIPSLVGLEVNASFGGWSWSGSGGPCQRGSAGTYVAHFFGNATGGQGPYTYLWSFDDGTNNSTGRDVTHVFALDQDPWIVTLIVADSGGASGRSSVSVYPAATSCPAALAPQGNLLGTVLLLALVGVAVGALLTGTAVWLRRRSRR